VAQQQVVNFCKLGQMSVCMAGNEKQQIDCSFYDKSQHANRCMYFIFEEYCDCLSAQITAKKNEKPNEHLNKS